MEFAEWKAPSRERWKTSLARVCVESFSYIGDSPKSFFLCRNSTFFFFLLLSFSRFTHSQTLPRTTKVVSLSLSLSLSLSDQKQNKKPHELYLFQTRKGAIRMNWTTKATLNRRAGKKVTQFFFTRRVTKIRSRLRVKSLSLRFSCKKFSLSLSVVLADSRRALRVVNCCSF